MGRKKAWNPLRDQKVREGILLMTPSLLVFTVFLFFPLAFSFFLSFQKWSILDPQKIFVGLDNYKKLLTDDRFINALMNTVKFTVGVVPVGSAVSLGLAVLINRKLRGINFFKSLFYLPVIPSMVVVSLIWTFILDPYTGLLTYLLRSAHIPVHPWLSDPDWAMPTVMAVAVWKNMGYYMVIFLAGLVGIPHEFYEAAQIDGAGRWQIFKRITLPLLRPTILFVLVMSMISSFQVFDQVYVMTSGGPLMTTEVGVFYIYRTAFEKYNMGYASAMSFVFFGITLILTYIELKYFGFFNEAE
jgi:multiple sugar transport system permease protein